MAHRLKLCFVDDLIEGIYNFMSIEKIIPGSS